MKKLWSVILTVVIVLAVLGCVVFALGLLMDADLVRIADVVFSNYDLAKVLAAVEENLGGLMRYLPI
jgi:hypothetical protein